MNPEGTEWVLLTRCPSIGHAELLLGTLRKRGVGAEIRGRHLPALEASPVEVWVQARNADRANDALLEVANTDEERLQSCQACGEESPANFETCWSCGVVLPVERR